MMTKKRFFWILVLLPLGVFILVGLLNFVVDPYQRNGLVECPALHKKLISYRAHYRLWKLSAFDRQPCSNILLGDSRIDGLPPKEIEACSGEPWANLAYGGGTAYEVVDTFWYAAGRTQLRRVVIGLPFSIYNGSNKMNLVPEARNLLTSSTRYYFSSFTAKVSLYNLLYAAIGYNAVAEKPSMPKDEFWQVQLGPTTDGFYAHYAYPQALYDEFLKIRDYCREHGIELVFIIPPIHTDLQAQVAAYGLEQEYAHFKRDVQSFGRVYDFDIDDERNRRKELYMDPYHGDAPIKAWVVETVWGKKKPGA